MKKICYFVFFMFIGTSYLFCKSTQEEIITSINKNINDNIPIVNIVSEDISQDNINYFMRENGFYLLSIENYPDGIDLYYFQPSEATVVKTIFKTTSHKSYFIEDVSVIYSEDNVVARYFTLVSTTSLGWIFDLVKDFELSYINDAFFYLTSEYYLYDVGIMINESEGDNLYSYTISFWNKRNF